MGVSDVNIAALKKCIEDNFSTTVQQNTDELIERVTRRIENWDIRCAKSLIDLFPEQFPKRLRGKMLKASMNEKGAWEIEPL